MIQLPQKYSQSLEIQSATAKIVLASKKNGAACRLHEFFAFIIVMCNHQNGEEDDGDADVNDGDDDDDGGDDDDNGGDNVDDRDINFRNLMDSTWMNYACL